MRRSLSNLTSVSPESSARVRARFLLGLIGEHAGSFAAGAGFLALTLWISLAIPRHLQETIDLLAADPTAPAVLSKVWLIVVLALAMIVTRAVSRLLFFVPGRRVEFDLKNRLLAHVQGLDREFFLANPTGELISRINNDITGVRMLLGVGMMMLIQSVGMLSLAPYYMYEISPSLTLYCALPIALGFIVLQIAVRRMRRNQVWRMKALQELSDFTVESYAGLDPLKSFRGLGWAERRFSELSDAVLRAGLGMTTVRAWFMPLLTHIVNALKVLLVLIGGFAVIRGDMTIGGFTAFAIYLSMLVGPLMGATFMMFVLQQGMTSLGSLLEVFSAAPRHPAPRPGAGLSEPLAQGLAVSGLRFAYPDEPDRPVLDEVSFHVSPGEVVGVFGPVGSGKTTLVNLLNRYLPAPPGTVHLDGIDIRDLDPAEVRRHVVTVTQEPFLFSDTLRENVAFSMTAPASESGPAMTEEVEKAIEAAALRPDLERMPAGLSTPVGERGVTLSGGQKQRIALARASLKPCDLLVLDDVLSAVDHETERVLVDWIYALAQARALLVVSHRISILERADRIMVLNGGRLVDEGTHDDLVARNAAYRESWRRQGAENAGPR